VLAALLQWLVWFAVPLVVPGAGMLGALGGLIGGLAVVLWWMFFSRAAWADRLGAIVLIVVALAGTRQIVHASIANGMMGFMLVMYAIPVLGLAFVAWAVATRRLRRSWRARRSGPGFAAPIGTASLAA